MKVLPNLLAAAVLAGLSAPAFADVEFDVIGGSEISFTGLVQTDGYWYDNDVQVLGSGSIGDGADTDFGMRRSELVFKGKGPGHWNWVAGYDFTGSKFLDVNVAYKFSAFTAVTVGQYKQPNSLEELSSTKNNDFISKAMTTNMQGVARRLGIAAVTGDSNWSITGSLFGDQLTRNQTEGSGYGVSWHLRPDQRGRQLPPPGPVLGRLRGRIAGQRTGRDAGSQWRQPGAVAGSPRRRPDQRPPGQLGHLHRCRPQQHLGRRGCLGPWPVQAARRVHGFADQPQRARHLQPR